MPALRLSLSLYKALLCTAALAVVMALAPAPVGPPMLGPPPAEAPPLAGGPSSVVELPAPPPPSPLRNRPLDLSAGLGFNSWTSGLRAQNVQPSFALDLAVGYALGNVY